MRYATMFVTILSLVLLFGCGNPWDKLDGEWKVDVEASKKRMDAAMKSAMKGLGLPSPEDMKNSGMPSPGDIAGNIAAGMASMLVDSMAAVTMNIDVKKSVFTSYSNGSPTSRSEFTASTEKDGTIVLDLKMPGGMSVKSFWKFQEDGSLLMWETGRNIQQAMVLIKKEAWDKAEKKRQEERGKAQKAREEQLAAKQKAREEEAAKQKELAEERERQRLAAEEERKRRLAEAKVGKPPFSFSGFTLSDTPQQIIEKALPNYKITTSFPVQQSGKTIRIDSSRQKVPALLVARCPTLDEFFHKDGRHYLSATDKILDSGLRIDTITLEEKGADRTDITYYFYTLPGGAPKPLYIVVRGALVRDVPAVFTERYWERDEKAYNTQVWVSNTEAAITHQDYLSSLFLVSKAGSTEYVGYVREMETKIEAEENAKRKAAEDARKSKI